MNKYHSSYRHLENENTIKYYLYIIDIIVQKNIKKKKRIYDDVF